METDHIYPVGDYIQHELEGDDCVCIPDKEIVMSNAGNVVVVLTHHSLDGREKLE